jgi:hypothetical protein
MVQSSHDEQCGRVPASAPDWPIAIFNSSVNQNVRSSGIRNLHD